MRVFSFVIVILCISSLGLASCYKDSDIYSTADNLRKEGRCGEAIPYYTQIIDTASNDMDLAGAYFYRGECQESLGNYKSSYEDYFDARIIVCHVLRTDYAPDEDNFIAIPPHYFCNTAVPNRMKQVAKHLSKDDRWGAQKKTKELLPTRFFE